MKRRWTVLLALAASCGTWSRVRDQPREVGRDLILDPQVHWNRRRTVPNAELWTLNGPSLDALRIYAGLKDRATLFRVRQKEEFPQYRSGMSPNDIVDLVVDSFSRAGGQGVQAVGLAPAEFAGESGFGFGLSYQTEDGLEMKGVATGAILEDQLYLMVLTGTAAHHFPKAEPHVRRLVASAKLDGR